MHNTGLRFRTTEEKKRYLVRCEFEDTILDTIYSKGTRYCVNDAKELLRVWLEDEGGDVALNRLINLIIY